MSVPIEHRERRRREKIRRKTNLSSSDEWFWLSALFAPFLFASSSSSSVRSFGSFLHFGLSHFSVFSPNVIRLFMCASVCECLCLCELWTWVSECECVWGASEHWNLCSAFIHFSFFFGFFVDVILLLSLIFYTKYICSLLPDTRDWRNVLWCSYFCSFFLFFSARLGVVVVRNVYWWSLLCSRLVPHLWWISLLNVCNSRHKHTNALIFSFFLPFLLHSFSLFSRVFLLFLFSVLIVSFYARWMQ